MCDIQYTATLIIQCLPPVILPSNCCPKMTSSSTSQSSAEMELCRFLQLLYLPPLLLLLFLIQIPSPVLFILLLTFLLHLHPE